MLCEEGATRSLLCLFFVLVCCWSLDVSKAAARSPCMCPYLRRVTPAMLFFLDGYLCVLCLAHLDLVVQA